MKNKLIAIPMFEERVSPLLDVAERFTLFEVADKTITQKIIINVNASTDIMRIHKLKELGVEVIISGAVSRYLCGIINETGIKHIPWISGPVDEVIESYLGDSLKQIPPEKGSCGGMMRKGRLHAGNECSNKMEKYQKKVLM